MKYELAKKLKNAGFPQDSTYGYYKYPKEWRLLKPSMPFLNDIQKVVVPTLSELIEACGEEFRGIDKTVRSVANMGLCIFTAKPVNEQKYKKRIGSTPEEAIAGLWLEIHKKLYK